MQLIQPFLNSLQIVLKPVCYKYWFSVCRFNNILQYVQFPVMYLNRLLVVIINCTICHLRQLAAQTCCIGSGYFTIGKFKNHLFFQCHVLFFFICRHLDSVLTHDKFRHFQMVGCPHRNCNVGDFFIYSIFRAGQRFVGIYNHAVTLVRLKVSISELPDKSS